MKNIFFLLSLCFVIFLSSIQAQTNSYVVVTISNDPINNQLLVLNHEGKQIQSVPTGGKGGMAPHIVGGGVVANGNLVAVINYDSQNVSLFKLNQGKFQLIQTIQSQTKPVSLAFGNGHLYILGTSTIESHLMNGDRVNEQLDGSARLLVGDGSAAQVGVLPNHLIISERSNMIELADLRSGGAVAGKINPVLLPPPPKNDTPVGLVTRDQNAYVTIAHSDEVGLVQNGKLVKIVSSDDQHAPCWLTLLGPWLYCSNTPSKTISRYNVENNGLVLEEPIVIKTQGEPTDIAAMGNIVAALELGQGTSHISQFQADSEGNLKLLNRFQTPSTTNGVAIVKLHR